jgi:unsaturated rhamnogalacturonyl hydrolase
MKTNNLVWLTLIALVSSAHSQDAPNVVTTSPQVDPGVYSGRLKVNFPTQYEPASEAEIRATLERVHAYLDVAAPIEILDGESGAKADLQKLPPQVSMARTDFLIGSYEWGVTYAGMLRSAEVLGEQRYRQYVTSRLTALSKLAAHTHRNIPKGMKPTEFPRPKHGVGLQGMVLPNALDDAGAMCAAFIKAQMAGLGGHHFGQWIDNYVDYVSNKQFRFADKTLARNRPLPNSLWLDDLYMSVPCLAQAGRLTGDSRYFDDAAHQILQFHARMFVKKRGLFMHAWVQQMRHHPAFHWARANGWAIMAMTELLEVLPQNHPQREQILEIYRTHAAGITASQGHTGLWHQLLDRRESYEETSASAMFVFAIAHGINRGWLAPLEFGPAVSIGWNAVAKKVNAKGQVEGTCVGTGVGWEPMFYMYRPVHVLAAHGYGPVLLAGAEMVELGRNHPDIGIHDGGLHFGKALE